jgi:hypothetical protein
MICAYLMHNRYVPNCDAALKYYGTTRTEAPPPVPPPRARAHTHTHTHTHVWHTHRRVRARTHTHALKDARRASCAILVL